MTAGSRIQDLPPVKIHNGLPECITCGFGDNLPDMMIDFDQTKLLVMPGSP